MIKENKKAWVRILEAFIAIILIAGVLIVLYARTIDRPTGAEEIYKLQESILEEVASNVELRNATLNLDNESIISFVVRRVPSDFEFSIKICRTDEICELAKYLGEEGKDVYSSERIISSTLQEYNPKKLKLFMWGK